MDFKQVKNTVNGVPRYVIHFLEFLSNEESEVKYRLFDSPTFEDRYRIAVNNSRQFGGKIYRGKDFGGGIVLESYNISATIKEIKAMRNAKTLSELSKSTADTQINFTEKSEGTFNITIYHDRRTFKETIRGIVELDSNKKIKSLYFYSSITFYKDKIVDIVTVNKFLKDKGLDLVTLLDPNKLDILQALKDSGKLGGNVVEEESSEIDNNPTAKEVHDAIVFADTHREDIVKAINDFGVITVVDNEAFTSKELNSIYKIVVSNKDKIQDTSVEDKVAAVLRKMDKQLPTLEAMSAAIDEAYNNRHLFVEVINRVGSIKISEKDIEEDFYSLADLNTLYKICVKKTNPITNQ